MGYNVELQGDGVRALRAYITQHAGDGDSKALRSALGADASLTTPQLRHAVDLLRRLRSDRPETPSVSFFFKQGNGVCVNAVSDQDAGAAVSESDSKQHAAYMERRRKKLLRLDEEMRYGRLVRNMKKKSTAGEFEQHQKSVRQHLSIGANMVAARVTAFVAMYILARTLTDNETTVRKDRAAVGMERFQF